VDEQEVLELINSYSFLALFNELDRLQSYDNAQNCEIFTQSGSVFVPAQPGNFEPSAYLKAS
jgi:hypothetical protein